MCTIKYQEAIKIHLQCEQILKTDFSKGYMLIFSKNCTKIMQSRFEEHPEFNTNIDGNPFSLLKVIQTLMHKPFWVQYPYVTMTDSLGCLTYVQKKEGEGLTDYTKRFKYFCDVIKGQLGDYILHKYIEHHLDYPNNIAVKQEEFKDHAFEILMAYFLSKDLINPNMVLSSNP